MERKQEFNIMRILFFILFSSFAFSQSFITELADKTVGKFLYDKNIKIVNDSIDIFLRVNSKGYCYALDFVSNDKTKFTLSDQAIAHKVNKDFEWIYNDSITVESLKYDEYQSCGDYLSHRGRNHRYDNYVNHANSEKQIYIILNSDKGYAVLVEPDDVDFLTPNNEGESNSSIDDWIEFQTLQEGISFLKSDEVIFKANKLRQVQEDIQRKNEEMRKFPISSLELPYKFRFGMSEQTVANHLKEIFKSYTKHEITSSRFANAKKKRVYKEMEYVITENTTYLKIELCFLYDKIIKIGYSHWDKNHSRLYDLDLKIQSKLTAIKNEYGLLFDILFSNSQIEGAHQIWSISENERLIFEEKFFEEEKFQRSKEIENKIGNKM
ncbi:hypothetical protein [Flavobacterium sp.]|uniref:hypothetical protein n=1 Tax=Flavobacterium sp. TaxID=239 RepID=UPI003D09D98E